MKKFLVFILLISTAFIFAHEVTTNLELDGDPDGDGNKGKGFKRANLALWWGTDNYLVDISVAYDLVTSANVVNLEKAWKKVDLWGMGDLTIGKQQYSFGRILTTKGYKNLQIRLLDVAPDEWMFKYHKQFGSFQAFIDGVWPQAGNADLGGRLMYCSPNFKTGANYTAVDFGQMFGGDSDLVKYYWEVDLEVTFMNFLKLAGQVTSIDDLNDSTDDMDYYVIASYAPGFELPYFGKKLGRFLYGEFRPYIGTITRRDVIKDNGMGESNTFFGINFMSFEDSYIKLEYTMDSDDNVDPSVAAQFGYRF